MKDLPYWTRQISLQIAGGLTGLEELAQRLGSIAPWNLAGNIVLMEDFESELTEWTLATYGSGSTATRSSKHKFSGDWAIKLTAGNAAGAYGKMSRYIPLLGTGKYALFCRIAHDINLGQWQSDIPLTGGLAGSKYVGLFHDFATKTLSVRTGAGTWDAVASLTLPDVDAFVWHPCLLIFDLTNLVYDKLYYDDVEYDISAYSIGSEANTEKYSKVEIQALATDSTGCTIYVDDIIIAKNVP